MYLNAGLLMNEAEKSKPPAANFFIKAESFSVKTQKGKLYESMTRHEKINSEDNTNLWLYHLEVKRER